MPLSGPLLIRYVARGRALSPLWSNIKLTRSGAPAVCHENVRLGIIRNRAMFPTSLCTVFPLSMDWYASGGSYAFYLC